MTRDILAILISSVVSESVFSTRGRILTAYRSSLSCNMVEALICAGDWLKTSNIEKKDEEGIDEEDQQKEFQSGKYISLVCSYYHLSLISSCLFM